MNNLQASPSGYGFQSSTLKRETVGLSETVVNIYLALLDYIQ